MAAQLRTGHVASEAAVEPIASPSPPARGMPAAPDPYHALHNTQQRLDAALKQIDTLLIERARLEQQVAQLAENAATAHQFAHHDELTGLPNRRLLLERFTRAVTRGADGTHRFGALLLDLDGFKTINDMLGHSTGDKLLQRVSTRLIRSVRASDTVCRLGGDEFLVLLEAVDKESTVQAAAKVRTHLCMPYVIDGLAIQITISMGIALYAGDKQYESLISRADAAMYEDKARGPAPPKIRAARPARGARDGDRNQQLRSMRRNSAQGVSDAHDVRGTAVCV